MKSQNEAVVESDDKLGYSNLLNLTSSQTSLRPHPRPFKKLPVLDVAIKPQMTALNIIAFAIGIASLGLFRVAEDLLIPQTNQVTVVRVVVGQGLTTPVQADGDIPGIALWNRFGVAIGKTDGQKGPLQEGATHDIIVTPNPGIGNVPADYLSITNGGDDAICLAGFTATFADNSQAAWSADVAAACPDTGARVFLSSRRLVSDDSQIMQPHCVWIDRDGSDGILHQGIGIHLPDFGSANQTALYANNRDLMCKSGPRFRMYEKLRTEDPILVFSPPIDLNASHMDTDPSTIINNPGVFAFTDRFVQISRCLAVDRRPSSECTQIATKTGSVLRRSQIDGPPHRVHQRHYPLTQDSVQEGSAHTSSSVRTISNNRPTQTSTIQLKTSSIMLGPTPSVSTTTSNPSGSSTPGQGSSRHRFQGHLVISSQDFHSAKGLCEHPNSYGPSFASLHDGWFCDMIEKKLYPICTQNGGTDNGNVNATVSSSCCFEIEGQELEGCSNEMSVSSSGVSITKRAEKLLASGLGRNKTYTNVAYW